MVKNVLTEFLAGDFEHARAGLVGELQLSWEVALPSCVRLQPQDFRRVRGSSLCGHRATTHERDESPEVEGERRRGGPPPSSAGALQRDLLERARNHLQGIQ